MNLPLGKEYWNGQLDKVNMFYAENGSGKTTLSLLFQSLSGDDNLLSKKLSFNSNGNIQVKLISDENKELKYENGNWNTHLNTIKVFNSHFIEDNVYVVDLDVIDYSNEKIKVIVGKENVTSRRRLNELVRQIRNLKLRRREIKNILLVELRTDIIKKLKDEKRENLEKSNELSAVKQILNRKEYELSESFSDLFLTKTNEYLKILSPNLQLVDFKVFRRKMLYGLSISNHALRSSDETRYSLKYTLSEGEKNTLALCFFFANLDLLPNSSDYIVVFDDPVTSFDYSRKNSTINTLIRLSNKINRLIILTHDINFANDFCRRISYNCQNLKIVFNGISSVIVNHDIQTECLTGIFKDVKLLNDFINLGATSETELRDVVRCIRPAIEGILRIKYFGLITEKEWLGDIIEKIKDAEIDTPFFHSKSCLLDLIEINNFSKEYHHSNPYYLEMPINPSELRSYVQRTISMIRKI